MTTAPPAKDEALDPLPFRDRSLPVAERVADLVARMTLEEKCAQLVGVWVDVSPDGGVAPLMDQTIGQVPPFPELTRHGLGQLTRVFGTTPVEPAEAAAALAATQRDLAARTRLGIPAMAHEECLTGFTAWKASVFPTPLAWGAAWDPDAVQQMAALIGRSMRRVGVHQGLAPVLDVVRDLRWGRVEECIGEDPYLVGQVGAAYVRGLESTGIVATLKHFAGYSASRSGRNLAPVHAGPREREDVFLPPFETALREGGARAVMNSYAEIDGLPAAADPSLLTGVLRERWGFTGTVVADYFAIAFLVGQHGVAADDAEAAALALRAGIDVELPTARCYLDPLVRQVRDGLVEEALVDRALRRVLAQKIELGLLDEDWDPLAQQAGPTEGSVSVDPFDLDPAEHRALARRLAERSVVLLADAGAAGPDGTLRLPLDPAALRRVAVVGPNADDPLALMGCYAFPNHVGVRHPEAALGIEVPTVLAALRAALPGAELAVAPGCDVRTPGQEGFAAAVDAARGAQVCLAVLGDRAGLFGAGTSGEGCDVDDLALPGEQGALLEELLATGTPVVLVLLTGRPYALAPYVERCAAVVQAFFPGEEGAAALVDVLLGAVCPSGRTPVSFPRSAAAQPATYLHPPLGGPSGVSALDPSPLFAFGHGLSYTSFELADPSVSSAEVPTDGAVTVACTVRNTGGRAGAEVVQLYLRDPVASVTRPVRQLLGFARVELAPGQAARVELAVHTDRLSFTGASGRRVVEPGRIELHLGRSSADTPLRADVELVGPVREVGEGRVLSTPARVLPLA
ncbi:MAG TPA: glycoside hydrolase family 3 N-terminal domain-containing protein [Motilibacteraceae bacterium]|nr:glycoside hydrolase family 3 N-terminal domain-containing protein [Motilibacteraceae bacterium]